MNTSPLACPNSISVGGDTWNQGTTCTKSFTFTQNIITLLKIIFLVVCNWALNIFWFSHTPPSPPPTCDLVFFSCPPICWWLSLGCQWLQLAKPLEQRGLQRIILNWLLQRASGHWCCGNILPPLPNQIYCPSPSPSPLKRVTHARGCARDSPSWLGGDVVPHRQLHIDVRSTLDKLIFVPPRGALPTHVDSAPTVPCYKVQYSLCQVAFSFPHSFISFVCHKFWSSSSNWPPYVAF